MEEKMDEKRQKSSNISVQALTMHTRSWRILTRLTTKSERYRSNLLRLKGLRNY